MQAFGDVRNPYGQTEALNRAMERVIRLCVSQGATAVTSELILRGILGDPACEGARAIAMGGAAIDALAPLPERPRPRADVAMIGFSPNASAAMGRAANAGREQQRPTSTGHVCGGLVEVDDALRRRLSVTAEAYRLALEGVEREQ